MKKAEFKLACGVGDNLVFRMAMDTVKYQYDEIKVSHRKDIITTWRGNNQDYFKLISDLGQLLFSEPPFVYVEEASPQSILYDNRMLRSMNIIIRESQLATLLCKGELPQIEQEYIVVTTKCRAVDMKSLAMMMPQLWDILNRLSQKYKIVILGEKRMDGPDKYWGYSIYNDLIQNVKNNVLDLTIPEIGINAPELSRIQQDCLIMSNAKFVLANGIGGNVWMAAASGANVVGIRTDDNDEQTDLVARPELSKVKITKRWPIFITNLSSYL